MEISKAVKLPYPTVSRIVLTLMQEGMIEKEPDRRSYRPTELVCSLASGYQDHSRLSVVSRSHLVTLTKTHGWAAVVSTRIGMTMIVRDCTHALSPYTLSAYYPGFVYPLLQSAAGRAYLAFQDETERELARRHPSGQDDDEGTLQSFICENALAEVRRKGYATGGRNRFTEPPGKNSAIAAPIFNDDKLCGVLSLIFLATALRMDRAESLYAGEIMATARAIGAELENRPALPTRQYAQRGGTALNGAA